MYSETFFTTISKELNVNHQQVAAVGSLLSEGATIPFIARYRKEATGSLDEVAITAIRDRLNQLQDLQDRRETVLTSLEKHGHLTDALRQKVLEAKTMASLEDIYLPYRPKRRTRAVIAREKGLEPLANMIMEQTGVDPANAAIAFVDQEKQVESVEDALSGARDILAEFINENDEARSRMRNFFFTQATIRSRVVTGMEKIGAKFKDYFDWEEPAGQAPSHRMLAMRRGEKENILILDITPDEEKAIAILEDVFAKGKAADADQVRLAVVDGYKRLLSNAMETEARLQTKEKADREAGFLAKTFVNYCCQRHWVPNVLWASIRDLKQAASWLAWIARECSCITIRFFHTHPQKKPARTPKNCSPYVNNIGSRR